MYCLQLCSGSCDIPYTCRDAHNNTSCRGLCFSAVTQKCSCNNKDINPTSTSKYLWGLFFCSLKIFWPYIDVYLFRYQFSSRTVH